MTESTATTTPLTANGVCQSCHGSGHQGGGWDGAPCAACSPANAEPQLRFEDLREILAGGLEPPAQLVKDLIVSGQVNWFSGHPEQGKTSVVMWAALQHVRAGGDVVWIDWETGPRPFVLRLREVGATDDETARFHYAYSPVMPADGMGAAMLGRAVEQWPAALVVLDSASKALSTAGIDENDNTETTRWTTTIVMRLRNLGATVAVIDHVAKSATRSVPYARGAGAKLADTEVAWYVEATKPFNRRQAGELLLTRKKDRNGVLPLEVHLSIGDGHGGLPIDRLDAARLSGAGFAIRQRVLAVIEEQAGAELTVTQVKGMVRGNGQQITDALADLAEDPTEPVSARPGPGNRVMYRYNADSAITWRPD